jgi:ribosomal protein L29
MQDIRNKSDQELVELVAKSREELRVQRFKDKFSKDSKTIHTNKKEVARVLTELNARRSKTETN